MSAVHVISGALGEPARAARVYGGELLVFKAVAALGELCALSDRLIRTALGDPDPPSAQFGALRRADYAARVVALQRSYRQDPEVRRIFATALTEIGVAPQQTCWDPPHLRIQPHDDGIAGAPSGTLGWHRDTWSSNLYAQTNWWTPLYPITASRTLKFHLGHWRRPLANTSESWDLEAIRAKRAQGELAEADLVPAPSEPVDEEAALRIVIEPGDLLCFSGAQLHASVPNRSGLARLSVEARTVNPDDVRGGRGAPNLDGHAPHVAWHWFRRMSDDAPLAELVGLGATPR